MAEKLFVGMPLHDMIEDALFVLGPIRAARARDEVWLEGSNDYPSRFWLDGRRATGAELIEAAESEWQRLVERKTTA